MEGYGDRTCLSLNVSCVWSSLVRRASLHLDWDGLRRLFDFDGVGDWGFGDHLEDLGGWREGNFEVVAVFGPQILVFSRESVDGFLAELELLLEGLMELDF